MTFVGVATAEKDAEYIVKSMENIFKDESIKIIAINKNNINNLKNIMFETIFLDDIFIEKKQKEVLKKIIKNSKNIILNSDIVGNLEIVKNLNLSIITYGFNSKATFTMSSVEDDNIIVCLQRNIKRFDGRIIEQQEKKVEFDQKNKRINNTKRLGLTAIGTFYEKNLQ